MPSATVVYSPLGLLIVHYHNSIKTCHDSNSILIAMNYSTTSHLCIVYLMCALKCFMFGCSLLLCLPLIYTQTCLSNLLYLSIDNIPLPRFATVMSHLFSQYIFNRLPHYNYCATIYIFDYSILVLKVKWDDLDCSSASHVLH